MTPIDPDRYTGEESVAIREKMQQVERELYLQPLEGRQPLARMLDELRAAVFDYPQRTPDELARMRVEATAPDLLDALEDAERVIDDWDDRTEGDCFHIVKIRSAIAKAKGERP